MNDPEFFTLLNADIITTKSGDFLGIREASFCIIDWSNQLEIGAALALRKKVLTVASHVHLDNPNIVAFDSWDRVITSVHFRRLRR